MLAMNLRMHHRKSLLAKTVMLVAASFLSLAIAAPVDDARNFARENEITQITTTVTVSSVHPTFATLGTIERSSTRIPDVSPERFRARTISLDDFEQALFDEYSPLSGQSPIGQPGEELVSRQSARVGSPTALPIQESDYIESHEEFQQLLDHLYDSQPGGIAADRNNYAYDDEDVEAIMRRINQLEHQNDNTPDDSETDVAETQVDCPICLEGINYRNGLALDCGHTFHRTCIMTWLDRNTNPSCPLCRKQVHVNYV